MFKLKKIAINKNLILVVLAASTVLATIVLISGESNPSRKVMVEKSIDYINKNILQQGKTATLVDFSEVSGVIKINLEIDSNSYTSYITKDGKLFFPEALDVNLNNESNGQNNQPTAKQTKQSCDSLVKTNKPLLEAYVVSRCPYGLQMQRVMADAIKNIPSLEGLMKVRYIGSIANGTITAMHGDAEAQENLRQICIREEQTDKYWSYVSCQMQSGDVAGCQSSTGINAATLNSCMTDSNRGLSYAKEDFDLSAKYNIQGSPTLILNGQQVSEFDFGGRSSDAVKTLLGCGFTTEPSFASTKLNTSSAATSFSLTYAGSGSSGNSGASGSNCQPAQ